MRPSGDHPGPRGEPPKRGARARLLLAAIFILAGVLHFVITDQYVRIMPPWLPWHRGLVLVSGVAEIAGGMGLLIPRLRRAAGIGLILLLVAVAPANWQMYLNAHAADASTLAQTLFLLRLPLQLALIWWVWSAACLRRR